MHHTVIVAQTNSPCRRYQLHVLYSTVSSGHSSWKASCFCRLSHTVHTAILTRVSDSAYCVWIDTADTHSARRCNAGLYTAATPCFFVDKPDITEQTVAILCRCQDLYWRRGTSAIIPSSETSSSSTSQRLSYITQEPEVHNRVYKSPYGPQFPLTCPFLVHGPFQRALPRPGRYVTSPNMLVCKMRSCWSCAQPPSWRTTPYRLIAVSTQLPVCSCDAQTSVQTRQLPAIEILHKRS